MSEMAFEVTVNAPYAEAMDRVIDAVKQGRACGVWRMY
jgi:hypothetical protein